MKQLKMQLPFGAWDYLPDECYVKRDLESRIRSGFLSNGYEEIETPAFEYYEVFTQGAVPYVQENMLKFFDLKGRILALRPDSTGSIARMAATKLLPSALPLRLCYIQNAYGYSGVSDKAEFTQAGVELIGKRGADADAEVIALAIQSLLDADVKDFKIDIGQVNFFKGLMADAGLSDEWTEKIRLLIDTKNNVELEFELSRIKMTEEIKTSLLALGDLFGGVEVLARARAIAKNDACACAVENLEEVYQILCDYGYEDYISIDFGILSNFNYYSGIVFRGIASGIGKPILSGGRYDKLLAEFGVDTPATGFAMGIKEILIVKEKQGTIRASKPKTTIVCCSTAQRAAAAQYAKELREKGIRVILECTDAPQAGAAGCNVIRFNEGMDEPCN